MRWLSTRCRLAGRPARWSVTNPCLKPCSPSLQPADFLHTCHFLAVAQEMRESMQAQAQQAQQAQQAAGGQQGAA